MKVLLLITMTAMLLACDSEPYDPDRASRNVVKALDVSLTVRAGSSEQSIAPGYSVALNLYSDTPIRVTNRGVPRQSGNITVWDPADGAVIINQDTLLIPEKETITFLTH